jgi:hypothetical protein
VVDDELDEDLHVALVGGGQEEFEVFDGSIAGVNGGVVRDVVAVVTERRGKEGEKPETGDAEILQVVKAGDKAGEVADAIRVGVLKGADVKLVDDCVFVPEWISGAAGFLQWCLCFRVLFVSG